MKKHLLLFIAFICTAILSNGQTNVYHPFPTNTAQWSEISYSSSGTYRSQLGIFGDTLIDSIAWHKLYSRSNCLDTVMTTSNSDLLGAIMEENQRLYYRPFGAIAFCDTGQAYKLYDFSIQTPGDTVWFDTSATPDYCYTRPYLTIDFVDSVLVFGSYRNRYHYVELDKACIEGIGSLRGLLEPIIPIPICGCNNNNLTCFKPADTLTYVNPAFPNPTSTICQCTFGAGLEELDTSAGIAVFPNPFSKEATITSTTGNFSGAEILLYNSLGQIVKRLENVTGKSAEMKKENLPPGLYSLIVMQGNRPTASIRMIID